MQSAALVRRAARRPITSFRPRRRLTSCAFGAKTSRIFTSMIRRRRYICRKRYINRYVDTWIIYISVGKISLKNRYNFHVEIFLMWPARLNWKYSCRRRDGIFKEHHSIAVLKWGWGCLRLRLSVGPGLLLLNNQHLAHQPNPYYILVRLLF